MSSLIYIDNKKIYPVKDISITTLNDNTQQEFTKVYYQQLNKIETLNIKLQLKNKELKELNNNYENCQLKIKNLEEKNIILQNELDKIQNNLLINEEKSLNLLNKTTEKLKNRISYLECELKSNDFKFESNFHFDKYLKELEKINNDLTQELKNKEVKLNHEKGQIQLELEMKITKMCKEFVNLLTNQKIKLLKDFKSIDNKSDERRTLLDLQNKELAKEVEIISTICCKLIEDKNQLKKQINKNNVMLNIKDSVSFNLSKSNNVLLKKYNNACRNINYKSNLLQKELIVSLTIDKYGFINNKYNLISMDSILKDSSRDEGNDKNTLRIEDENIDINDSYKANIRNNNSEDLKSTINKLNKSKFYKKISHLDILKVKLQDKYEYNYSPKDRYNNNNNSSVQLLNHNTNFYNRSCFNFKNTSKLNKKIRTQYIIHKNNKNNTYFIDNIFNKTNNKINKNVLLNKDKSIIIKKQDSFIKTKESLINLKDAILKDKNNEYLKNKNNLIKLYKKIKVNVNKIINNSNNKEVKFSSNYNKRISNNLIKSKQYKYINNKYSQSTILDNYIKNIVY